MQTTDRSESFWSDSERVPLFARNVISQYVVLGINVGLGLVMLPFNVSHLGQADYGLWVLVTSLTTYFDILEMGYGSAQVKFTAQYRARRDATALNEVTSTLFFLFIGIALLKYTGAAILALNVGSLLNLSAEQVRVATSVLLTVSIYMALSLPFSVFGSITNGFQRYHLNNLIFIITTIAAAVVNVVVLLLGYGIVELVMATTAVRLISLIAYRRSAYKAFPLLRIRWSQVRRSRLTEVTGLSAYLFVIDIANKVMFTADTVLIGAILGTAPVAVYSVGQRLAMTIGRLTRVVAEKLFPTIVDMASLGEHERLQFLLIQGTRLSLAMVIPVSFVTAVLAEPIVLAWVGPQFTGSIPIVQLLALAVAINVGGITGQSMLKGTEHHRFVAVATAAMSIANLALSIVLAYSMGLVGVALGSVIPTMFFRMVILWPKACRSVGLPVARAVRLAVWPAVWPTVPLGLILMASHGLIATHRAYAVAAAAFGLAAYAGGFFLAVPAEERRWYRTKLLSLARPAVAAR